MEQLKYGIEGSNPNRVTLNAHDGAIRYVKSYQTNFLASCSFDETIKIWDLTSLKCLKTLYDHKDIVRELKVF
jgi:WD40 repeat protein